MKIAVIGAGAFGTALGEVLTENRHIVSYYDPKFFDVALVDVVSGVDFVVFVAPSNVVPYLLPHLPRKTPLIIATKGILDFSVFSNFEDVMALSGPGFAEDIKAHNPTFLTATDERVARLFGTEYLKFDFTPDLKGVLMCGALKNVYAILAGRLGVKAESPKWEEFIADAANEMRAILAVNGGDSETVDLACGVGDLRLSCNLPSRNYEFGEVLQRNIGAQPEKTVEGASALKEIRAGKIIIPNEAKMLRDFLVETEIKWN